MDAPNSPEYKAADDKLGQLLNRANEISEEVKAGKAETAEIRTEMANIKTAINEAHEERESARAKAEADELVDWLKDFKEEQNRAPSKARLIGSPAERDTEPENFFATVAKTRSNDYREAQAAQDRLNEMGLGYRQMPSGSQSAAAKTTLGTTDAAGGYLIPNNLVAQIVLHASNRNPYRQLMNVITGVRGDAVDQPTEGLTPTRATVQAWGATKSNTDLTVANYTATLYTLAHILDVANQFLRHSEGAAEQLVRSTLARKLALGEAYYILAGSGSSEPKGILTSIGTSGTFVTSHTAGATQVGSIAHAIAEAAGPLADRNRVPDGAIVSPSTFWTMVAEGTDSAGFFFNPAQGPGQINANGVPSFNVFGIRVIPDANMVAAGATDDLLVGEFSTTNLYIGDEYRVDVSSEAGDRWDKNLTGFRAEEEMAFNADAFVVSGHYQRILDVIT
jgi:HK97 family phage major capsid protein